MKTRRVRKTTYQLDSAISLTIALVTDFHNDSAYLQVLDILKDNPANLIAIAGDLFKGFRPESNRSPFDMAKKVLPLLETCAKLAPTVMSIGNHDWLLSEENVEHIKSMGITVLDNEWTRLSAGGYDFAVGGLTSAKITEYWNFRRQYYLENGTENRYPYRDKAHT